MTEAEKRRIALEFFNAEQNRASVPAAALNSIHTAAITSSLETTARKNQIKSSLAQQGITWEELRDAYEESYSHGKRDMLDYQLGFFYSSVAIVVKELHPYLAPEGVGAFMESIINVSNEFPDKDAIVRQAFKETGINFKGRFDIAGTEPYCRATMRDSSRAKKSDVEAVFRMQKSGITAADLEYERQLGYKHGQNCGFFGSACYAALAIALKREFNNSADEIEEFINRAVEIQEEEISVPDILERCERETEVDVSGMIGPEHDTGE